ncbi:terpene cyclase/mutase family protein [Telmatocola sphagniphila]|jgi:squalene cyclase|uniref:Terpene cyclase/mutase family protein n=1 Tax=Telmatocola sphagniphila TaxID=1123043 RepID=A0A8E6B1X0_9BACT|nr:prenyltransferase/squalene oxidase repeat-containing protein [Telmatocola sphagniphila]QVL30151.1 terpene cyclase/mutase family protein [Telmatocola sphagniphila]
MRTLFFLFAFLGLSTRLCAAPPKEDNVKLDEPTKKACERAYDWLKSKQNEDGSWGDARYPHNTAITSFVLLAYMSQGHIPNQGKYGPEVAKGIRFIIASARESDGYLAGRGGGNMYCHGMSTLVLSQAWGMTKDEETKNTLKRAVDLIVRSQSPEGGWRYSPSPSGSDISVTIMQVMALRGAKDSGIHVPDKTLKNALEYINKCYDPGSGGYCYMPMTRAPGFARTAAGVCVVKLTGEYDKNVDRSIDYMLSQMDFPREHYWYGHYYACHAMHQVGGKAWEKYYTNMRNKLLESQNEDGNWTKPIEHSAGTIYSTAIGVIILSVPANYLPIFQR